MNINVPLTDKHLHEFNNFVNSSKKLPREKRITEPWLGKNVFYKSQSEVNRLKKNNLTNEKISYLHITRFIRVLKDDKRSKPLRRILAEHIIHEFCAELPRLDTDSFPFKCKIDLSNVIDISILKKHLAKCYLLEDFDDDIGLPENIIVHPNMDNTHYLEGFLSALVYLLYIIEEVLHRIIYGDMYSEMLLPTNLIHPLMLLWLINLMGTFNMMQWQTAFDKDNPTEYDSMMCFRDKWIIDSSILQLSPSLHDILVQFCPNRQMKLFYIGWHSFCDLFSEHHITKTNDDKLLYFRKIKYILLDSLSSCLDQFLEKRYFMDHIYFKYLYDLFISIFETDGYEELEKTIVFSKEVKEVYEIKNMENILLCCCNKVKGIQVVIDLLFSIKLSKLIKYYKKYPSQLEAWRGFINLLRNMKKYFGTEKIAIRQMNNFKIDILNEYKVSEFINNLKSARKILYVYRHRNKRNRQGKQDTLTKIESAKKTLPRSFAAINEFKNREEFCHFLQSSEEIIDYFSDSCEETNAEFLRLFLKVNKDENEGDFNAQEIAAGLRTVLIKDK